MQIRPRVFFIVLFVFILKYISLAQDIHFSQFYQSSIYLNPGFVGITNQQRLVFNYRIQWPSLPQSFSTYAASYDIWIGELKSGFGILATTDKKGSVDWRTTTAGLLYSYKIKITDKIVVSPGIYFGYGINGLDQTKLTLGDGLEYEGVTLDPSIQSVGTRQYFDFTAGILVYTPTLWIGASFNHINTPNISVLNITSRLPMKINIHGGMRIPLSSNKLATGRRVSYLTPSFVFRLQGPINQLDLGVNYHVDPIYIGVWYRGKPYEVTPSGLINQDALIFQLGAYLSNFTVGYSYDFSISPLSSSSGGAHEISIIYEFSAGALVKRKKNNILIPCPTVGVKSNFFNKN